MTTPPLTHKQALAIVRERMFRQALQAPMDKRQAVLAHLYQFSGGARGMKRKPQQGERVKRGAHSHGLPFDIRK